MTVTERELTVEEKGKLHSPADVIPYIPEEIDDFETEVTRFLRGGWEDPVAFTGFRLLQGVYGQRQPDVQMVRIFLRGGWANPVA